ncbi:MAG TPA: hypothetical protein DHW61_01440 [Lachnoclostridium phytofermentans]|uniref:SGNH hydrolase-type esterase domain-containing protein n=1 Tax=Lachnoclostridium phytofermentans TaxID=66219 RepID=A0A3D2X376_9FIRM|nr:rhamnogalacturonan acetylesterase [Lachnoclostridium sp.]HCL01083.1 hypothetical protein [Lachnoclostridium phytofermentans]
MNKKIKLNKNMLYSSERGYGFITEPIRDLEKALKIPELNSGFDILYWYMDSEITGIMEDEDGCYAVGVLENGSVTPVNVPLFFKLDIEGEDNYLITLKLKAGDRGVKSLTLFGGRRHLHFHNYMLASKEELTYSFLVNVSDIIPRNYTEVHTDRSVDFAIIGDGVRISEVHIQSVESKTIFLAGDSTVTDQPSGYPYEPGACYCGWGQALSAYLSTEVAISNHAHSGLTTESFRNEGHYDILTRLAKPGDIVLFQFGHNDQKLSHLKAEEGYRNNLIRYIMECREKDVYPVLISPLSRNTWREDGTQYVDLLVEYDKVCKQIGEEYDIPIIDLHERSKEFILKNGIEVSKRYFYPGDYTHSNDFGGFLFAGFVAEEMKKIPELAKFLTSKPEAWIPDESLVLPQKPGNPVYETPPEHTEGYQIPFSGIFTKSPSDVTKELEFLCGFSRE